MAKQKGDKYGTCTAIDEWVDKRNKNRYLIWECECGHIFIRSKYTRNKLCPKCKETKTHGLSRTPTYKAWSGMLDRCYNPNNKKYHRYGGRGIKVCDRWKTFLHFYEDMGEKPAGLSLDRINNDGDYEPSNCRWATPREQAQNRSNNVMLTIDGETHCLSEWSRRLNVSRDSLRGESKK